MSDTEQIKEVVRQTLGPALRVKSAMELIDIQVQPGQVRILARQPQSRIGDLVLVVHQLLSRMNEQTEWKVDISKAYFLKEGRVVQAVRFILQTTNPAVHIPDVVNTIHGAASSGKAEIDEIILPGANPNRHVGKNGKGAVNALQWSGPKRS